MAAIITPKQFYYYDVFKVKHVVTIDDVLTRVQRINAFFDAIAARFPGREEVIRLAKLAFATRGHLLLVGPPGCAKTLMWNMILENIDGAEIFEMDLSKDHKPTDIFGEINPKIWRETGMKVHNVEGMLTTANFARLGEFSDVNDFTGRTLNPALNMRKVRLGKQTFKMPLMSVLADTNFDLTDQPSRVQQMAAVYDRFLFRIRIDYLEATAHRLAMFANAADNAFDVPLGMKLDMEDVVVVSGFIKCMNLLTAPYLQSTYEEATKALRLAQKGRNAFQVSDRRQAWGLQVIEACALFGRLSHEPSLHDVEEARVALCYDREDHEFFETDVPRIIGVWEQKSLNHELEQERDLVEGMFLENFPEADVAAMESEHELAELVNKLKEGLKTVGDYEVIHSLVRKDVTAKLLSVSETIVQAEVRFIEVLESSLSTEEEVQAMDFDQRRIHLQNVETIIAHLRDMSVSDRSVRIRRHDVLDKALQHKTYVEMAALGRVE